MSCKIYIILFFGILWSLTGCYEVTEGDLYEFYKPKVVIEAQIDNQAPPYFVKISYSAQPDDTVDYYLISGAIVNISDNNDNSERLTKISPNTFAAYNLQGNPEVEYYLNILVDGLEFEAREVMPKPATVYKTEVKYINQFVPVKGRYIKLFMDKNESSIRYYKIDVTKNDSLFNDYGDLIIFDDAYADDTVEYLIPYAFNLGDSVNIDVNVINENNYRYYYALKKQTTNTFSNIQTPLKNPPANISNQPLGFFQVSAITRLNIVIGDN